MPDAPSSTRNGFSIPFQAPWWAVLSIVGLDYLSTLGYQPSLAYQAAGRLAPLATVVVVLVTLFAALPVYLYIAGRAPHGGGAASLFEALIPGWRGKLLILILLGFTATDFVLTRTFSAAAAAEHLIHNPQPQWQAGLDRLGTAIHDFGISLDHPMGQWLAAHGDKQLAVTLVLLLVSSLLAIVFVRQFTRGVLFAAMIVVGAYLLLNAIVVGAGLAHLADHPNVVRDWWQNVTAGDWQCDSAPNVPQSGRALARAALAVFPRLALGLSGFELTMIVMPLIRGRSDDDPRRPRGRIGAARRLLVVAAVTGSIALLSSSFVTSLLIPPSAYAPGGPALHRAIGYLAHGEPIVGANSALSSLFGPIFGTIYDLSAVSILCLAGASISIGLRDFVPPYLHRLGMELNWSYALGALVYLLAAVKFVVTITFHAELDLQRNAYVTAVLALLTAAAFVCALDRWHASGRGGFPWLYGGIALGFAVGTLAAVIGQPGGLKIAGCFIAVILLTSVISRSVRATELRFERFDYADDASKFMWESLRVMDFPVLVPRRPGERSLAEKEAEIRKYHRLGAEVPIVFVEVSIGDASGFCNTPILAVAEEAGRFVIYIERCTSVAHVLAVVALELSKESIPPELHFGWSDESPLTANLHFLLFGHGNVPWMVQHLLNRAEPDPARRPRVIVG